MQASDAQFVAIDFESTGVVGNLPNEPWQIGMAFLVDGHIVADTRFNSLLRIGDRPFNPYVPGRHAVLRPQLAEAPSLPDLWSQLSPWLLGRPLVAHNAVTERKILEEAFPLHETGPWIDTLELSRIAYPRASSHRLEDLLGALGLYERVAVLCPDLAPHDALFDAMACASLFEHLLELPHWQGTTVDDLVSARAGRGRARRR